MVDAAPLLTARSRLVGALVVALASHLVVPVASADAASEASLQFELGAELYRQRRYTEAVERFLASNRLAPNPNVTLNIAQTLQLARRWVDAYNWYETYLTSFELDEDARQNAIRLRDALGARVAVVDIETTPPGAALFIDRVELGTAGISPRRIALPAGTRRVIARLEGHRDGTIDLDAALGEVVGGRLELSPLVGSVVVRTEPPGVQIVDETSGASLGEAPATLSLRVGRHTLAFRHPGHVEQRRSVEVLDEATVNLDVRMSRAASQVAVLTITSIPPGARVTLDGADVGVAPLTLSELDPGPRHLSLDHEGRERWGQEVVLEAGGATRVEAHLADRAPLRRWRIRRWGFYGAAAAALLSGLAVGIAARGSRGRFFDDPSRAQLDRVRRMNLAADLTMSAAVVSLSVVVIWDLTRPDPHSRATIHIDR